MIDLPITPRENYIRMLRHENPLWMPMGADRQMFSPSHIPDNVARATVVEAEPFPIEKVGGPDMFGINWVYVPQVRGSMEDPNEPHLFEDIEEWRDKVVFPDMDAWDWAGAAERNKDYFDPTRFRQSWFFTGMFERLISFMGFEGAAMTLIDEDCADDLHALFDALADNAIGWLSRMKKWFDIDAVFYHDDWGSQRAPFFSLRSAREMIAPHIKKIVDYCHANGMFFEFHSCGKNEPLVPAMVEMGVDFWAGQEMNDKLALYQEYGDKLAIGVSILKEPGMDLDLIKRFDEIIDGIRPFVGGGRQMYLQEILPGATPEEAEAFRDHVRLRSMELFAAAK